jgi:hypothetical protein
MRYHFVKSEVPVPELAGLDVVKVRLTGELHREIVRDA